LSACREIVVTIPSRRDDNFLIAANALNEQAASAKALMIGPRTELRIVTDAARWRDY